MRRVDHRDAGTSGSLDVHEEAKAPRRSWWDRSKVLLGIVLLLWLSFDVYAKDHPKASLSTAWRELLPGVWPLVLAAVVELGRQVHLGVSARWRWYARTVDATWIAPWRQVIDEMDDWSRYRLARAWRWAASIAVVAVLAGAFTDQPPLQALLAMPAHIWSALPLVLQVVVYMMMAVLQFVAIFWFMSRGGVEVYNPGDIRTRFDDVWGQDHVVDKVRENIIFLQRPKEIEDRGGHVPGGILLWGPPGTGKTLMAEAMAGETGKPYVFVDPGAFNNMFMGVGILKVRGLFRRLRKLSLQHGGVVVFFDEADSLGSRGRLGTAGFAGAAAGPAAMVHGCHGASYLHERAQATLLGHHDRSDGPEAPRRWRDRIVTGFAGDQGTLQALLTEISGLRKPRGIWNRTVRRLLGMPPLPPPRYRILVVMATNMPDALDEALLRPGRIDRSYRVGYPNKAGRIRTYEGYLAKVRHDLTPEQVEKLATITPYATGASMKDLVNESLINAIREDREVVTWTDVNKARHLRQLGPSEGVDYIDRERHATAIHEACHAVAAHLERHHLEIDLATIEKGGTYLGMVASIPPEDQFSEWRSEYESSIVVALASLAGERMFFDGDNSSGVMGDLRSATIIAAHMEGSWGMGATLASHDVLRELGVPGAPRKAPIEAGAAAVPEGPLAARIEAKLAELYSRAESLLAANRRHVFAVAHALETHRTISGDDIAAIIDGVVGPTIDGRAYANPAFLVAAEAYHDQALQAHKDHARIPIPMPIAAVPSELL